MYENVHDVLLKQKIIKTIESSTNGNKQDVLKILYSEFPELSIQSDLQFCECGYPISYKQDGNIHWLEKILKTEVDFDRYKEYYYCPRCDRLLADFF